MMVERNTASASMTVGLKCLEPQEVITHFTISLFGACGDPYGSESGTFNDLFKLLGFQQGLSILSMTFGIDIHSM